MIARILCLIVLILEIIGLSISFKERKWKILFFYTQLSNMITAVSALLLLVFGDRGWVVPLRYLSTSMLVMTFLVTVCVLIPMGGDPHKLLWSGNGLFHHVLCPVISTVSYLLFEKAAGRRWIWLPVVVTLAYGLVMLYLNAKGIFDGPYPFFRVRNQSVQATVLWMVILTIVITVISAIVMALSR